MTDKYSPPVELWSAQQCAKVLGYRNTAAWKYAAQKAKVPVWTYDGTRAMWRAQDVREAVRLGLV